MGGRLKLSLVLKEKEKEKKNEKKMKKKKERKIIKTVHSVVETVSYVSSDIRKFVYRLDVHDLRDRK